MNIDNVRVLEGACDKGKRHRCAHTRYGIAASIIKTSATIVYRYQLGDTGATRSPVERNSLSTFIFGAFRSTLNKNWRPVLGAFTLMALSEVANAQTVLPVPVNSPCIFHWFNVPDWFPSAGQASIPLNGLVNPADSIHFPGNTNCDFYKWSSQMFLWLTSPAPSNYGQGSHVFNSPIFYDVSPPDATSGRRTLIRISPGNLRSFGVSIPQRGPQGKPVVFDKTGKMFTVVRPQAGPGGKTLIRNKAGQPVEIERIQVARNGKPIFLDKAGKAINFQVARNGSPLVLDRAGKQINFQPTIITINGRAFFQGGAGTVIDIEQGQADGSVLMAQTGSLVYYALQVNDVYASFLTGQKIGAITATNFPTTQVDLTNIQTYAGIAFPDAKVLTVEIKSAWIETTGLPDVNKYVTINATVPAYTPPLAPPLTTTPITHAVPSGTRPATLALVGMHVVGTVLGHPEMIWATFEHVNNTPNAAYTYNQTGPGLTTAPHSSGGTWLFSATPAATTSEPARMRLNGANIEAISSPPGISPANILRVNPWGTSADNANFTTNNTDIIAINLSAFGLLDPGDVRRNYILTGTTWTAGGDPSDPLNQTGTNQMANTTLESFEQPSNCFMCHNGNMLGTLIQPDPLKPPVGDGLSHIYGPLRPLISK